MLKKIFLVLFCLNFLQSCGYVPMYSSNQQFKMNIVKIDFSGDWELNNFINNSLKRYETTKGEEYNLKINTIYTKNSIKKENTGKTTAYQIDIEANINVTKDDLNKKFLFREKFTMNDFSNELDEKNYERSNKNNVANLIVNKLIIQLLFLE